MPTTLATTLGHISDMVPNPVNSTLLKDFHSYLQSNSTSDKHQNNTLKAMIAYARFVGHDMTFYQIGSKEQITSFLDTKVKDISEDPDMCWITTWNHYLVHIKYFFRWLHNHRLKVDGGETAKRFTA
jgi:hypothetical protein